MGYKRLITPTRQALACWVILLVLGACSSAQKMPKESLRAIRLSVQFNSLDADNNPVIITDSLFVMYYRDYTIYKTPNKRIELEEHMNAEGELTKQVVKGKRMTFQYFIFRQQDTTGYLYDTLEAGKGKPLAVADYRRRKLLIKEENVYLSGDALLQRFRTDNGGYVEIYHRTRKRTMWDPDTCRFTFSKEAFTGIDFSLHHLLDSLRRMRVVGISTIGNPDPSNSEPYFRMRRESKTRMEKISPPDSMQVREFLDKLDRKDER